MEVPKDETQTFPRPAHWQLISLGGEKIQRAQLFLQETRRHIQKVQRIKMCAQEGHEDLPETIRRILARQGQDTWDRMIRSFALQAQNIVLLLRNIEKHHKSVLNSFFSIMQYVTQDQTQLLKIVKNNQNWVIDEEGYIDYILMELLKATKILKTFVEEQNQIYKEINQLNTFYHQCGHLFVDSKQKHTEEENIQQQSTGIQIRSIDQIYKDITNSIADLTNQIKEQGISEHNFSRSNGELFCMSISTITLVLSFSWLIYCLSMFDHYDLLSNDQDLWKGPGVYLAYLWINCFLVYFCKHKHVNVVIAMNSMSPQDMYFYQLRWIIIVIIITSLYFLVFSVYLISNQSPWIGIAFNIVLVIFWVAELCYRMKKMFNLRAFVSKLSFLHCMVVVVPVSQILCNCFYYLSAAIWPFSQIFYLVFTGAASILLVIEKGSRDSINELVSVSLATIFSEIFLLITSKEWVTSQTIFKIANVLFNFILLCLFIYLRYPLFTLKKISNFMTYFCRCRSNRQDSQIYLNLMASNTFSCGVKFLIGLMSLLFMILLCLAPNWNYFIGQNPKISKYVFQIGILVGYLFWNLNYISEVSLQLRPAPQDHNQIKLPLSICTHFSHAATLINDNIKNQIDKFLQNQGKISNLNLYELEQRKKYCDELQNTDLAPLEQRKQQIFEELKTHLPYYFV